ncbi:AAA family ATPase [Kitasatospora sp. NPDC057692]|uniref:AAA family ATPase n=1 Tax=Kitasatospora sp. NPDC057692 TaxID=3346215 RepID=UPI0036A0A912
MLLRIGQARTDDIPMKIHSIAAQNFLSFASLDLSLKPGTTVVTGPNGAGKSNPRRCRRAPPPRPGTRTWRPRQRHRSVGGL